MVEPLVLLADPEEMEAGRIEVRVVDGAQQLLKLRVRDRVHIAGQANHRVRELRHHFDRARRHCRPDLHRHDDAQPRLTHRGNVAGVLVLNLFGLLGECAGHSAVLECQDLVAIVRVDERRRDVRGDHEEAALKGTHGAARVRDVGSELVINGEDRLEVHRRTAPAVDNLGLAEGAGVDEHRPAGDDVRHDLLAHRVEHVDRRDADLLPGANERGGIDG
jgi:hypothetical protein